MLTSHVPARQLVPERMDDPALPPAPHHAALRGLARLNAASRSDAILWPQIHRFARRRPERPLRCLDVATGAGDLPVALWRRFQRAAISAELHACDVSAAALEHAGRRAERAGAPLRLFWCDILSEPLPQEYDIITCSLFLHHLDQSQATILLKKLSAATRGLLLINDLRRCRRGIWLAWAAARVLSRSPVVHADAVLSARAAFTPDELLGLARAAGLGTARVAPRWPLRMLLTWERA